MVGSAHREPAPPLYGGKIGSPHGTRYDPLLGLHPGPTSEVLADCPLKIMVTYRIGWTPETPPGERIAEIEADDCRSDGPSFVFYRAGLVHARIPKAAVRSLSPPSTGSG